MTSPEKPRRISFSPFSCCVFTFFAFLVFALSIYITSDDEMLTRAQNSFRLRQLRIPHVDPNSAIGSVSDLSDGRQQDQDSPAPAPSDPFPSDAAAPGHVQAPEPSSIASVQVGVLVPQSSNSQPDDRAPEGLVQAPEPSAIPSVQVGVAVPASSDSEPNDRVAPKVEALPGSVDQNSGACDGRRIYIYSLPADFNEGLAEDCKNWVFPWWSMCDDVFNGGMGERMNLSADPVAYKLLQPASAWYRTDQFSLEVLFHSRVKTYPCLTSDPKQASLYFIPFYPALDLTRHVFNNNLTVRDDLTERLLAWLREQPSWNLTRGHRHLLVLGRISWDFRRTPPSTWGSALLSHREVQNLTTLIIERTGNLVAVPYPTNFHPASDSELQSWQATVRGSNRTQFVSFAGSSRGRNVTGTVRGAIFDQCWKYPRKCKFLRCTEEICGQNAQTIYKLALESVFCLQPAGDSPTRKGIFDSLLSGCIPVLFNQNQAVEQYVWHLKGNGSEYSVLLDGRAVTFDQYDVVKHLERIPKAEVQRLQENIVRLLPSLLYRNPKLAGEYTSKDAFDVAVDAALDKFNADSETSIS